MNQLLQSGTHAEWLTQGWTVLIMKDPQKGTIPPKYQPITCVSTTWKLLSGIRPAKVSRNMGQYMSWAQRELAVTAEEPSISYWLAGQLPVTS